MTEHQDAEWNVAAWHGKMLIDRDGEKIGKLQGGSSWFISGRQASLSRA